MAMRFRKSIKVAPGVRVNLNKKSTSVTVGGKGAHFTASSTGKKTTSVGIPGTGVSYVSSSGGSTKKSKKTTAAAAPSPRSYKVSGIILLIVAVLIGLPTVSFGGWIFLTIGAACLFFGLKYIKMSKEPEA